MRETTAVLPDTPLMRQYRELKSRHQDTILFFRLGDFYEMFADDARTAAPVCGLFLTSRQGIPMCGIPHHNHGQYVAKLIRAGYKVAIADQMEEPSKTKKLVAREVVRTVTPGTVIEVSTGEFWTTQSLNDQGLRRLKALLSRLLPAGLWKFAGAGIGSTERSLLACRFDRRCDFHQALIDKLADGAGRSDPLRAANAS